jgi:hypothetical protein
VAIGSGIVVARDMRSLRQAPSSELRPDFAAVADECCRSVRGMAALWHPDHEITTASQAPKHGSFGRFDADFFRMAGCQPSP